MLPIPAHLAVLPWYTPHQAWCLAEYGACRHDPGDAAPARANLARANLAGADLAGANLARAYLAGADLARANLARAYLAGANLARANLADADLADADLADAYLARANLAGANLARANLADAYLAGADLAGANLARAYLAGADLARALGIISEAEEAANWKAVRVAVLAEPARLVMSDWHGRGWDPDEPGACGTTHCLAGWAQALSSDPVIRRMDALSAGLRLIPRHAGLFYATNERVLDQLRAEQLAEAATPAQD